MNAEIEVCRTSLATHSKSFSIASRLLPVTQRDYAAAVYAWCRHADDAVDNVPQATQAAALRTLRSELASVYRGDASEDPILTQFRRVVRDCRIPQQYPSELLDGMEMDVAGYEYSSWDDLLVYCYRVASTVGLMMCCVMGVSSDRALPHAIDLGIAMQLTNIARDVNEDWHRGRLYLPDELLAAHGLSHLRSALGTPLTTAQRDLLRPAIRELLQVANRYYVSGDLGLRYLSPRNAFTVASARWIYSDIGVRLGKQRWDVLGPRAFVPLHRKLVLVARAAVQSLFGTRVRLSDARQLLGDGHAEGD